MSFTLKETIDLSNADYVSGHPALTRETKARFVRYAEQVRKQGTIEVEYTKKIYDNMSYGRYWPSNNDCLARQSGRIRSYFLADEYVDIDIVKAAPSIMIELANEISHPAKVIRNYRDDFAGAVRMFKLTDKQIKTCSVHKKKAMTAEAIVKHVYNMVTFGAGDDAIAADLGFKVRPEKYAMFRSECQDIAGRLIQGKYRDIAQKISSDKSQLAILSLIIQEKESTYVREMMTEFQSAGIEILSYIFDGFVCRRNDKIENVLKKWNANSNIQFIVKPWPEPLNDKMETVNQYIIVESDEEAAIELKRLWPDRIIQGADGWYAKMPTNNFWSYGCQFVKELIMMSQFRKPGDKIYGGNASGFSSIFKAVENRNQIFPVNETFLTDINEQTKGRVYFCDRYYDLNLRQYIDITENDVVPLCYIKRNAPKWNADTTEAYAFLLNILGDKETVNIMLHALSRALGGYMSDKVWYLLKGARSSGKGMLQEICHSAFGDYIAIGDAPSIRSSTGDPAQEARWIISSRATVKRLLFTNEVKVKTDNESIKLDGGALKKYYCSGGDTVQSRLHNQNECRVINNAVSFFSLNESPTSNPADAMETCRPIIFPYKFVGQDLVGAHHTYRLADPNLKSRLKTDASIRDGFLRLVLEAFKPYDIKPEMMPKASRDDYSEIMSACLTEPAQVLLKLFDQGIDLWEASENVYQAFEQTKKSQHSIGKFLKLSGFLRTQRTINGNRIYGFQGLALKPIVDDDLDSLPDTPPPKPSAPPPAPKIEPPKPVSKMPEPPKPLGKLMSFDKYLEHRLNQPVEVKKQWKVKPLSMIDGEDECSPPLSMEDLPRKSYKDQEREIWEMIEHMDLH